MDAPLLLRRNGWHDHRATIDGVEQHVQYAVTDDGFNIAYAVIGSGPVLVSVPSPPDNHLQLEWDDPERRRYLEQLADYRTVVRFDPRGSGLSDRGVDAYSIEHRLRDLEAVVRRLGPDTFALLSGSHGVQPAVAYAARHPERVTHLVAVQPFVDGTEFMPAHEVSIMERILEYDFDLFTQNVGAMAFGWGSEEGPRYSAYFKACVTQQDAIVIYRAMLGSSVRDELPSVGCPALVVHGRAPQAEIDAMQVASARRFAAAMPNATMAFITSPLGETGNIDMLRQVGAFFGEDWSPAPSAPRPAPPGVLRTILFTDIVNHTEMMDRLGDAAGRQVLRDHERITRDTLRQHQGREVKTVGDSFMASFESVTAALQCATALQQAFAARNARAETPIEIRAGINAGEPIEEDDDLFGASVIAASRIKDHAGPGQIYVSNVVRELVAGKGFLFADLGEQVLRGLEDPVRMFELHWDRVELKRDR